MNNLLTALSDNIVVDTSKCTGCGVCVERCILDNLRLLLPPCREACPLGVNCQGYARLIAQGKEEEALELIRETLPFPAILGRVCSQPCEAECNRAATGEAEAVSMRALKRYLTDEVTSAAMREPRMAPPSGKRVAIVGSGPAGLLAAYDLRIKGHEIVVFEREASPGGMLRWAIPEFRLPAHVLDAELEPLTRMGVEFRCNTRLGHEIALEKIRQDFDAVLVATGCGEWKRLGLAGEELAGVLYGLPFLRAVRAGEAPSVGKTVAVIGGGNVAVIAAQTALRLGAESVTVVCLESPEELPAFPWAVDSAVWEDVHFKHGWGPVSFSGREGKVTGIELRRCVRVFDESGAFAPRFDDHVRTAMEADSVIVAIGQSRDLSAFRETALVRSGLTPSAVKASPLTLQTPDEKVFVAGDFASGPSSVVEAMASGRKAAESIARFLNGESLTYGRAYRGPFLTDFKVEIQPDLPKERTAQPRRLYRGAGDFEEIEQAFDRETARREASRCNSCGRPVGFYRTCWFCLPCEVACPQKCLRVEIPYLLR